MNYLTTIIETLIGYVLGYCFCVGITILLNQKEK